MGIFSFLRAEKVKEKIGSSVGPAYQDPPQNDEFKAYIPNFLYKPPFGYPLNKNVLHLKALARNPFIFSVIRTLKDEASTTKWEIKLKKEYASEAFESQKEPITKAIDKETEVTAEPAANDHTAEIKRISDWFYNPNGNDESFNEIIGQWIQDLCEVDAAVGVKVFNKKNEFSQLFARDGGSFLKNPDIYGYIGNRDEIVYSYREMNPNLTMPYQIKIYSANYAESAAYYQYGWTGNALPVPFGRREIMYMMANPRTDSIYGRSPLEVIEDVLITLIYGTAYNTDFYLNGNMPDGMVNLVGADADIAKAFQDRLKDKFKTTDSLLGNSRRVGHQYPVYGGPAATFVPFQISSKDMEIIEQQKWFTKLVWSAFGVTADEMGYTEESNKAVSQTQTAVHKRKALKPMLKKIEYMINNQLMTELDPSGKLEFAFEDYDVDEELKKAQLYQQQITGGWKTAEMVAEEEGIDMNKLKQQKIDAQTSNPEMGGKPSLFDSINGAEKKEPNIKHKYIKREGGPGNYVYFYKDGSSSKSGGKPKEKKEPDKETIPDKYKEYVKSVAEVDKMTPEQAGTLFEKLEKKLDKDVSISDKEREAVLSYMDLLDDKTGEGTDDKKTVKDFKSAPKKYQAIMFDEEKLAKMPNKRLSEHFDKIYNKVQEDMTLTDEQEEGVMSYLDLVDEYYGKVSDSEANKKPEVKADYLKMDLNELIEEHKKLVAVLEKDNPESIKKELEKQRDELQSYIDKKKASIKSDKDDISKYFEKVRAHLIEQIEKDGTQT